MITDNGVDITEQRFGRLVAKYPHSRGSNGCIKWLSACDCGGTAISFKFSLTTGKTLSCGCLAKERQKEFLGSLSDEDKKALWGKPTHGMSDTKEFKSWSDAKSRCTNEKHKWYPSYGGRGISMCDRWLESFENFLEDMGFCPKPTYSLDRIDVNKGYIKENCRWASPTQQQRNRTDSKIVDSPYGRLQINDLSDITGLGVGCLLHRIESGWSWEDIINKPSQRNSTEGIKYE